MAWSTAGQNHLLARNGYMPRWFLWVDALETDHTSAPMGIWSGTEDWSGTIDGQVRDYYGWGTGLKPDTITFDKGTTIRTQQIRMDGLNANNLELVRGRIIRGRAAELHLALFDPISETMIDYNRMFKGFVNRAPSSSRGLNGVSGIQIELASQMRALTRTVALKKSDQSQKARNGDPARAYSAIAAQVSTEWNRE